MKEDLDIFDPGKGLKDGPEGSAKTPEKEDLTITKAQARLEELEKELQRLKDAKASKESDVKVQPAEPDAMEADIKAESAEAKDRTADKITEPKPVETASEISEPKKIKTNAEAYASSEKNVADMLAEYDSIAADDRKRNANHGRAVRNDRPANREQVPKRPVNHDRREKEVRAKAHAENRRAEKPIKEKPVRTERDIKPEKAVIAEKAVRAAGRKSEEPAKAKMPKKAEAVIKEKKAEKGRAHAKAAVPKDKKAAAPKGKKVAAKKHSSGKKQGAFLSNLSGMDYVIGLTGVLVLVAAILTFSIYSTVKNTEAQIAAFVPVGENLGEIGIAGESTLLAMADNREEETIVIEEEEEYTVAEYDEKDDDTNGNTSVSLKLQTVVKDLKIKFVNGKTGKLIPGVPFEVEITDSAGKKINKTDDDKDGIIYIKSITPGEAKVKMVALTGYDSYALPKDVQTIIIKETLDYKKIDVADEVKTEAQVNVAAEDTAQANVTESELKDTVEWVESTKTAVSGSEGYVVVSRDEIDSVPDAVKNGQASDQANAGTLSNKAREVFSGMSDLWSLKVYAEENESTTEEQSSEATPTPTPTPEPSSEAESKSESESEIDWNHKLSINGIKLYVDKECTTVATYKDYAKQTEFYCSKGNGGGTTEYKYTGWQTIDGVTYFFDKDGNKVTGDQVIQGAKYSFGADGALKTGSGVLGIDVSKWNGSIDWNQVKNSGISYVIIRCGYRGSTTGALIEDPTFRSNIKGAQAAGLKVGVYFFTQATDEVEAVEEASMTLSLISGYKLSYPVFLDVEASGGRGDKIDSATRTKVINAYCQTIRNSGYSAGVYANRTWLSEKFSPGSISGCKIWLAQYAATPTYGGSYQIWQYSSKGSVAGIKGNVDMNLSYMN